jgi:hypothetical protein
MLQDESYSSFSSHGRSLPKISGIFDRKSACSSIDLLAFLLLGKVSKYRQKFLDAGVALMNICDQA